ncbi:HAD superfamily hydrolase (TIGR01490 family) [Alkalispirillum mobile]|uniref:Histidinol-phosphatase n=1 Tax=Alkalispirillum mobile TaxID=85925 RepID=A0A498CA37_9GAMM|nr:HAD family hydrolase [Alkalispirillum mobile]RLK51316.1 HAD superfamily hydrolase (TIGR01490 family) [Alkalispirillum mobile]
MKLAIFDLDNTLLAGDSDHLWGEFLVDRGLVDEQRFRAVNNQFLEDYQAGRLDIDAFLRFTLKPLAENPPERLWEWRRDFIETYIRPIVLPAGEQLLDEHRAQGHQLMIITATNRFVTEPIADLLGVDTLLATEPEWREGRYTGHHVGTPTFQAGKVRALDEWLGRHGGQPEQTWFYSDSHNDLPLLEQVDHPVAVDPDPVLRDTALDRDWPVISLREHATTAD